MRSVSTLVIAAILLIVFIPPAPGDDPGPEAGSGEVGAGETKFYALVAESDAVVSTPSSSVQPGASQGGPVLDWFSDDVCSGGGERGCARFVQCEDGSAMQSVYSVAPDGTRSEPDLVCLGEAGEQQVPQVTDAVVAEAFARIPVPSSELVVQPPGGRTLVNFETNFYTTNTEMFVRSVRLLGQRVQLRIRPVSYTWVFGDGGSVSTQGPGAAYPRLRVTHRYVLRGPVGPRVDTRYAATWRLGGGAWRPVPGTVSAVGEAVSVEVRTARPKLVS